MQEFLSIPDFLEISGFRFQFGLGKFRENSGELSGIQWGFVWRLVRIQREFLGDFGERRIFGKFEIWGGFG